MNPHAVLGVAADATSDQIKSAYRKLAMQHHPDRNGDSEESKTKFREIQEAYEALTKPQQKDFRTGNRTNSSPFEDFFHGFHTEPINADFRMTAGITLEQAFTGCTLTVSVNGKALTVSIPAGVQNRSRFTVEGEGSRERSDLKPGNLHIIVIIHDHAVFQQNGPHLVMVKEVSAIDCLLGCEVEVITIAGEKLHVKVPRGSSHQTQLRVREKGMPWGTQHGDLMIMINPVFETLTDEQCDILRTVKKA